MNSLSSILLVWDNQVKYYSQRSFSSQPRGSPSILSLSSASRTPTRPPKLQVIANRFVAWLGRETRATRHAGLDDRPRLIEGVSASGF